MDIAEDVKADEPSEMVERVARALAGNNIDLSSSIGATYLVLARAAIEAMMEPSDKMLADAELGYITSMFETEHNNAVAKGIYQSMLRSSLKGEGE